MPKLDIGNAATSDYANTITGATVTPMSPDVATGQDETTYQCTKASTYFGYFNTIPNLKAALVSRTIWIVGRGWTCSPRVSVILDHISGDGKQSFLDVLYSLYMSSLIYGDSYAEIIKDEDSNLIINIKQIPTNSMKVVYDKKGIIKRYEQTSNVPSEIIKFQPNEILHLSNNKIDGQIHGISSIESLEDNIKAGYENDKACTKLMKYTTQPLSLWKLKTDNMAKILQFKARIENCKNLGEDLFLPDDEDIVTREEVKTDLSPSVFQWRDDIRNTFYRTAGIPELFSNSQNASESSGKIGYLTFQQPVAFAQLKLELTLWHQLHLEIHLNPPESIAPSLSQDANADGMQQEINIQPGEMTAGVGK